MRGFSANVSVLAYSREDRTQLMLRNSETELRANVLLQVGNRDDIVVRYSDALGNERNEIVDVVLPLCVPINLEDGKTDD